MEWSALLEKDEEKVQLKGFLYPAGKGVWVFTDEPHLKSCCIGSEKKRKRQLFLKEDYSKEAKGSVIALQGYIRQGEGGALWLQESALIHKKGFPLGSATLLCIGALLLIFKLRRLLLP